MVKADNSNTAAQIKERLKQRYIRNCKNRFQAHNGVNSSYSPSQAMNSCYE